jgi:hypothetical protein
VLRPTHCASFASAAKEKDLEASFELSKSTDGQFYFVLKVGNAETITHQ